MCFSIRLLPAYPASAYITALIFLITASIVFGSNFLQKFLLARNPTRRIEQ